jgi:hypothetical protein
MHCPLQSDNPGWQAAAQTPVPSQTWPVAQAVPQVPQFRPSTDGLMHWPWHSSSLARQVFVQVRRLHTFPAGQMFPQLPQLSESPPRLAQYAALPLPHWLVPPPHESLQAPAEQT